MDDHDQEPTEGDAGSITRTRAALAAAMEHAVAAAEQPAAEPSDGATADDGPPLVRARWIGQPVWNPEQGVIGYGDPIEVTAEQLEDGNTLAIAWADDWSPDPELAAVAAAALGENADEPEEG